MRLARLGDGEGAEGGRSAVPARAQYYKRLRCGKVAAGPPRAAAPKKMWCSGLPHSHPTLLHRPLNCLRLALDGVAHLAVANFFDGVSHRVDSAVLRWSPPPAGGAGDGGFVPLARVTVDGAAGRVTCALSAPAGDGATLSYGYDCGATGTLVNAAGFPAPAFVKVAIQP